MRGCVALALLLAGCGDRKPAALFHEQETGLHFTHRSGASGKFYMTEIMGAGVALFDYDNDGDLDVFFVQSVGESKLFRNELVPGGTAALYRCHRSIRHHLRRVRYGSRHRRL